MKQKENRSMRRSQAPAALLLGVFLSTAAAAQDRPPFKMPCRQVLKLGLDRFTETYTRTTRNHSERGYDRAYQYFYHCRREQDDAYARSISKLALQRTALVREALANLENARLDLHYAVGGGTMYIHAGIRLYAVRE